MPDTKISADLQCAKNIVYGKGGRSTLKMDEYRLKELSDKILTPVLRVHGGGWYAGSKNDYSDDIETVALAGFSVFNIDYRLSGEACFPAQIEDCKCAVRFLRANGKKLKIKTGKIGAIGGSAGGHLVALLGTSSGVKELEGRGGWEGYDSSVAAVCNICGVTDIEKMKSKDKLLQPDDPKSAISMFLGGLLKDKKEVAAASSPLKYISRKTPPFLIIHGDSDDVVPMSQSALLYKALLKAQVKASYFTVSGAGHAPLNGEMHEQIAAFFKANLPA
ncbi:MAG: alpha/beta hydrolase [Candidatus Firestonebacteria bacterium]